MRHLNNILLILILVLAAIFRFWQLPDFPISLNWDEISHGYNAYSLIQTGKDQWGISWPFFNFRAYGDYPTTVNMYLSIPLIKLFGLNEWTTRLPNAILSWLTLPFVYLLSQILFKSKRVSLLIMSLYAFSPWTLFTSRAVFQSTIAQFFLISGIAINLYAINKKPKLLLLGSLLWLFSAFAYHNTKIVAPLLFLAFIIIYRDKLLSLYKNQKQLIFSITFIFLLFSSLLVYSFISNSDASARSRWVFILNDDAINLINHWRSQVNNPLLGRLLHNKVTYFLPRFVSNYLNFFNPLPLFFQGSGQYQFGIPSHGILYSVFLPFFYLGTLHLFLKKKNKSDIFLLVWLFVGLLPAALTYGDFQTVRSMSYLPLPFILIAMGMQISYHYLITTKFSKIFIYSIILIFLLQFTAYWRQYIGTYQTNYALSWQYGYKQMVNELKAEYGNYNNILISKKYGEPHEFILFYWPWDPNSYLTDTHKVWDKHADWYWVDAFDKFTFLNDWEIQAKTKTPQASTLLISSPGNYNQDVFKHKKTIYSPNGQAVFDLVAYE